MASRIMGLRRALRPATQSMMRPAAAVQFRGIKFLDTAKNAKAQEAGYFHEEDMKNIEKMIQNDPTLDPEFQGLSDVFSGSGSGASFEQKVQMLFLKHGIPKSFVKPELVDDIAHLAGEAGK